MTEVVVCLLVQVETLLLSSLDRIINLIPEDSHLAIHLALGKFRDFEIRDIDDKELGNFDEFENFTEVNETEILSKKEEKWRKICPNSPKKLKKSQKRKR